MRVVYNACYGGFGLSAAAVEELRRLGALTTGDIARHDARLVDVVERLRSKASATYADLRVTDIEGTLYRIHEYDGHETVMTPADDAASYIDGGAA